MKSVAAVCFFGVFAAVTGLVLREINPKYSNLFSLATSVVLMIFAWKWLSPVAEYAIGLAESENAPLYETLLKATGVAILVGVTADLCRDLGEKTAADRVETCGRAALALMALPLVKEILERLSELV